ncbi:MAG: cytochrome c oxidase subunit II [Bdellovibrio sp.]
MNLPLASNFATTYNLMFNALLVVSGVLVFAVWFLIIYFCIKYRRGSSAIRSLHTKKFTLAELYLSGFIFLFGLSIFIWSAKTYHTMFSLPKNSLEINVIAKQWLWIFRDVHSKDNINSFKIPMGKPVRLVMTSLDVVHSLFIPAFRIKQDVLPGRYTSIWFTATKTGTFDILCTQYCGLNHSQMRATVEVLSPEDYQHYLKEDSSQSLSSLKGAKLYSQKGCIACHDGMNSIGPSLKGIFDSQVTLENGTAIKFDENYIRQSILQPNAEIVKGYKPVMPSFQGQLTEEDLVDIINYLKAKR